MMLFILLLAAPSPAGTAQNFTNYRSLRRIISSSALILLAGYACIATQTCPAIIVKAGLFAMELP